jgi:hypothetical protein
MPTRVSVEEHVVITDFSDRQSKSFDIALVNRDEWPRLFEDGFIAVMAESVAVAIEIKSELDGSQLEDIFSKAKSIAALELHDVPTGLARCLVAAFAYRCENPNLRFLDFALHSQSAGSSGISGLCILNVGYFGLVDEDGNSTIDKPNDSARPCFFDVKDDALLFFLSCLIRWSIADARSASTYLKYSKALFQSQPFMFDQDFLELVQTDSVKREIVRKTFFGQAHRSIRDVYNDARIAIGL